MGFDDNNEDDIELSLDELHKMIEEANEIEIDLDDFVSYMNELKYEQDEEEERELERQECVKAMRDSLESGNYGSAFEKARTLKSIGYSQFREEIEECYVECANHGVLGALIFEADKYTKRGDGRVKPEAFPYLEKLNNMDYIDSFRWLADCYYRGIGCERDLKKAERLYFEAMLFSYSDYSREMYMSFHPDIHDYAGENLLKRLIQCYAYGINGDSDLARVKIAELILEGAIKEFEPATAYALLKHHYSYDGLSYYRLGECILNGIGTDADPIVAKYVLETALDDLEWMIRDFDDEWTQEYVRDSFHEEKDFIDAYGETKRLIEQAQCSISKMSECDIYLKYGEDFDEELIYEEWEQKPVEFVKRSRKRN